MFLTFKKWTALYLLTLLLLFAGFAAILWQGSAVNASKNLVLEQGPVLVIDPGHGGMDGGAMAADGTVEAQIWPSACGWRSWPGSSVWRRR